MLPSNTSVKHKISISLDKKLHQRLIDTAKKDGRSLSNFLEQLAHKHLTVSAVIEASSRQIRRPEAAK